MKIDLKDAKARLHQLMDAAIRGEEVILTRAGQPCVQLLPVQHVGQQTDQLPERQRARPRARQR